VSETNSKADFCITIDYEKGIGSPSRVFRAMSDLIDAFQETDKSLVGGIDAKITPILLLEDVQTGSVKSWFKQAVESIDDEGLKKGDWKQVLGKYLVDSKYAIIRFLDKKVDLSDEIELEKLVNEIYELSASTQINHIPAYEPIPRDKLLNNIDKINTALSPLNDTDKATFSKSDGESASFNLSLYIAPESISDLITSEVLETTSKMILKVKKPDFLGNSQWEFKHDNRIITARILDDDWLESFRNGNVVIRPGDAIRANVLIEVNYGYDREVVSTNYRIITVDEVIDLSPPKQTTLFDNENT
jgi:hypothetical protein